MELFRNIQVDWLARKWYFLGFSLIFSVAGLISMFFWHGIPLGVDFRGGTLVYVKTDADPSVEHLRHAMDVSGLHGVTITRVSDALGRPANEVIISLPENYAKGNGLDAGRSTIVEALQANYHDSGFSVEKVEVVGPEVGTQLTHQAELATLYSLAGMLIYLWFRFELIYGVAAVVAVFHDTLITLGAFSLTNQEMTLTVVAAILTLIGYSMNDTIVVFDRIRENLRTMRRETLSEVVNRSINQTMSRTILTSGLTFLTVLSLYLFGGEVLHGFSFALVVGILIGTYSSIAVAAPMLVAYQDWRASKGKRTALPTGKRIRA